MKSLIKKFSTTNLGIQIRNSLGVKPIHLDITGLKFISISDAFAWRTDNNFITKFKFSNILGLFYNIKNSWVEIHFYSKENNLLKIEKKINLEISNEIIINSEYLNGLKDYGTFYIYHFTKEKLETENIISNRCYLGYSQNNNMFSIVHGNALARFTKINKDDHYKSDIIKTSLLLNNSYKIQKYFNDFDKSELFFSNPTSKKIKFTIDEKKYELMKGNSLLIDISYKRIITIKSNCNFLRPTVFSYKNNYLDVHHS